MTQLEIRCQLIQRLFSDLLTTNSRVIKESIVAKFRLKYSKLDRDLDYCFEVLAGKHKLGYTYMLYHDEEYISCEDIENHSIKHFIENYLLTLGATAEAIRKAFVITPISCRTFIMLLMNRDYKLGYSNKHSMITNLSPMLAKRYPDTFTPEQYYYIQEKLDGNRCVAYFDREDEHWHFQSRSGKPMKLDFDMSWADIDDTFDGEVMTLAHAGSRDFNKTSGAINSKYGDKSGLHYFIYDIIKDDMPYCKRKVLLSNYDTLGTGNDCSILPVLDYVPLYANLSYNWQLDEWLDKITAKGGEGIILRDPNGLYEHKRSNNLIKYKKTQTMDLRIVGWNEGSGKYAGMIGSFICQSDSKDELDIQVNVAGMSDSIRSDNPDKYFNKIIEVAYFDKCLSKNGTTWSLRFPRMKQIRDDKNETSIY